VHPHISNQHAARAPATSRRGRPIDQARQLELGLRAQSSGDRAAKPERCLPRCTAGSIACSLIVSDNLASELERIGRQQTDTPTNATQEVIAA
jgi:hypothetical protein